MFNRVMDFIVTRRLMRPGRKLIVPVCGQGKAGATAGWVITGASDIAHATLPASITGGTMPVPLPPLSVGSVIRGVSAAGRIASSGGSVSLIVALRKVVTGASGNTDSSVASKTVTATANTKLSELNARVSASEKVVEGNTYYVLLTGTTAASTSVDITHFVLTIDEE